MKSSSVVLDHRLYVPLHLTGVEDTNARFFGTPGFVAHLANQLLAFDTVLIPTMDFALVPHLMEWVGADMLAHLVDSGTIRFVRRPSMLSYVGNGNGINLVQFRAGPDKPFSLRQRSMWAPLDEALEAQLDLSGVSGTVRRQLVSRVLDKTVEYHPSTNDSFIESVERQSYRDVLASEPLKASIVTFEAPLSGDAPIDLKRLPSVAPNQTQLVSYDPPVNGAQVLLQVAEANYELLMAAEYNVTDLYARHPADHVFAQRLRDAGVPSPRGQGVLRVVDLVGAPDFGLLVEGQQLAFSALVDLRESKAGQRFRLWLGELDPADPRDVERAIVNDLLGTSRRGSVSSRIVRLVTTTGLGLLNPVLGVAAAVTDSLVVDRLSEGWRPRLFLQKLKALADAAGPSVKGE